MTVVGLVSAKGTPGVTTTAAALTAAEVAAGRSAVWVELDPSGGTGWVQTRASCPGSRPTLADLVRHFRDGPQGGDWLGLATEGPPGVPSVLAPPGRPAASALIAEGSRAWRDGFASGERTVVFDCGRWYGEQPLATRIAGSDVIGLVCRSTLESIEQARHLVGELVDAGRCPHATVVVGDSPYSGTDAARALGLPLAGVIEWHRGDVGALWARGAGRQGMRSGLGRSGLGRSAARALAGLVDLVPVRRTSGRLADRIGRGHPGPSHFREDRRWTR